MQNVTEDIENLIQNAAYLKKSGQADYETHELFKRKIRSMNLEPEKYEETIHRLCEVMGL